MDRWSDGVALRGPFAWGEALHAYGYGGVDEVLLDVEGFLLIEVR